MAAVKSVSHARFRIPVPLVLLVVLGVGVWFFFIREKPKEVVDPFAGIQTTPIDGPLDAFRLAWDVSDFNALKQYELREEDDDTASDFDHRASDLGWHRDGLPKVLTQKIERPQKVRYTIHWTVLGFEQPVTTFWEWTSKGWRVATWRLPQK